LKYTLKSKSSTKV